MQRRAIAATFVAGPLLGAALVSLFVGCGTTSDPPDQGVRDASAASDMASIDQGVADMARDADAGPTDGMTCGGLGAAMLYENPCPSFPNGLCLLDHMPTGFF
jgi:hypothetical protein